MKVFQTVLPRELDNLPKAETKREIVDLLGAVSPECSKKEPITISQPWRKWNPTHRSVSERMENDLIVSLKLKNNSFAHQQVVRCVENVMNYKF